MFSLQKLWQISATRELVWTVHTPRDRSTRPSRGNASTSFCANAKGAKFQRELEGWQRATWQQGYVYKFGKVGITKMGLNNDTLRITEHCKATT